MHKCSRLWLEVFNSWPELWSPPAWSGVVGHRQLLGELDLIILAIDFKTAIRIWVFFVTDIPMLIPLSLSGNTFLSAFVSFYWHMPFALGSLFPVYKRASMTRSLVTLCGLMCWTKIGIFHEWSKNQFQCVQVDRFLFWSWTWKFLDVNGKWTLFFKAMKIEHFVLLKNRQKTLGTFGQFYVWRIQKLLYL